MNERRPDRLVEDLASEVIAPLGRRSAGAHEAVLVAAGTIGVLVGLAGRAWAPWSFALAVATGAAGIIAVRLTDRWKWPWQELLIVASRDSAARQVADLGARLPADLDGWLEAHPPGSVPDRWRASVLVMVGRTHEARAVIGAMARETPAERVEVARLTAAADAVDHGTVDSPAVGAALDGVADPTVVRATMAHLAVLRAAARVEGSSLREIEPPVTAPLHLGPADQLQLWRARFWPVEWFAGTAIGTWLVLGAIAMFAPAVG